MWGGTYSPCSDLWKRTLAGVAGRMCTFKKLLAFGKFQYGSGTKSCLPQSLLRSSVYLRAFWWEHVQGWRDHPLSSRCITETGKRYGHPAGSRVEGHRSVCPVVFFTYEKILKNYNLHVHLFKNRLLYVWYRNKFVCQSLWERGIISRGLSFFFFPSLGFRKQKVRLKSHLLKPEASFETLPAFLQSTYEQWYCFLTKSWIVKAALPSESHSPGIFSGALGFHEDDFKILA